MARIVFAILAGALISLAGAPHELSFTAFLGPAALLAAVHGGSHRHAALMGLCAGLSSNAINLYWVVGLLQTFGGFPLILALLVGALLWLAQSLSFVAASLWAAALGRERSWTLPASLVVFGTITPAIFPWRIGLSQLPWLPYAQIAEVGGLPLLDLLFASVGGYALVGARSRKWPPLAVAAIALLGPFFYGSLRLPAVREERAQAPLLRVGVVQPNIDIWDKHDFRRFHAQLRLLHAMTRELEAGGADLVLWSETAYPYPLYRSETRDFPGPLAFLSGGVRGPLLAGAATHDGRGARYNSAVAIERGGRITGIADKVRLMPFGEYVPLWDFLPPIQTLFPRGLREGHGLQTLAIAGARVGVLNCYEDLFADYVRDQAAADPELWANVTNDAWFGNTSAPRLHHFAARMRAIETRRDLIRAVNTGVSGHVLATGEDAIRTEPFVRASFIAEARRLHGQTPWVRFGDLTTPVCAAALIAAAFASRRRAASRGKLGVR